MTNSKYASRLILRTNILESTDLLFSHGRHHCHDKVLSFTESILDLSEKLVIGRKAQVVLGITGLRKKGNESILRDVDELVVGSDDLRNITIVGGRNDILEFFCGEDINTDKVALSVAVLPRLRGGDLNDLAGALLDHNVAILSNCTGLLRERFGSSGVGLGIEVVIIVRHGERCSTAPPRNLILLRKYRRTTSAASDRSDTKTLLLLRAGENEEAPQR